MAKCRHIIIINFISLNVVVSVKTEICREGGQRQTITDSIKKTSDHTNETTTITSRDADTFVLLMYYLYTVNHKKGAVWYVKKTAPVGFLC